MTHPRSNCCFSGLAKAGRHIWRTREGFGEVGPGGDSLGVWGSRGGEVTGVGSPSGRSDGGLE